MKKLGLVLLALMSINIVACSNDENPFIERLDYEVEDEAQFAFKNSTSECADPDDCPSYVGSLYSFEKTETGVYYKTVTYGVGFCSQTLIGPNRILTNRHCLPDGIHYKEARCRGKLYVKFPKTSQHPAEEAHCRRVIDLADPKSKTTGEDWAIIELESNIKRPHVEIDTTGIEDQIALLIYPNYYTQASKYSYKLRSSIPVGYAEIKAIHCTSDMANLMADFYNSPTDHSFTSTCDYKVIKGNSGSGVFSSAGKLKGVLSWARKEGESSYEYLGQKYEIENKIGGGTNAHCIEALNPNSRSKSCDLDIDRAAGETMSRIIGINRALRQEWESQKENFANLPGYRWKEAQLDKIHEYFEQAKDIQSMVKILSKKPNEVGPKIIQDFLVRTLPMGIECVEPSLGDEGLLLVKSVELDGFAEDGFSIEKSGAYKFKTRIGEIALHAKRKGDAYQIGLDLPDSTTINHYEEEQQDISDYQIKCSKANKYDLAGYCQSFRQKRLRHRQWYQHDLDKRNRARVSSYTMTRGQNGKDFEQSVPICQ